MYGAQLVFNDLKKGYGLLRRMLSDSGNAGCHRSFLHTKSVGHKVPKLINDIFLWLPSTEYSVARLIPVIPDLFMLY